MLHELRIRDLGVIEDAVLSLSPGLNVVTGETGAGKTMVVHGLGLVLGGRADGGLVRAAASAASVEAIVDAPEHEAFRDRVRDTGGQLDGAELVLARTVGADGRSRAYVGGRSAPVGVLAELGEWLAAVHGQADQWRLKQSDQHRQVVDDFAGPPVAEALAAYRHTYEALAAAERQRRDLEALDRERSTEAEALKEALELVERVDPQPGEDVALREESDRLAHAETLRAAAGEAHALLTGDADAAEAPAAVQDALARARSALARAAHHDPALAALEKRVAELGYLAGEVGTDLAAYLADVSVDPARLAWVQQRRSDLALLTRRFGGTVDDVLADAKESADRLARLFGMEDELARLADEVARLRERLAGEAATLSRARAEAATRFGEQVTAELGSLAMATSRVTVALSRQPDPDGLLLPGASEPVRFGPMGVDHVQIELAAHSGMPARSVAKGASGGELSRVMLAVEVVAGAASGHSAVPTFVFDEVDAGVGGAAAVDVGARLATLAEHAQVVVVTHLAQVAAYAERHHVVRKQDDGTVTASTVTVVEGDEQVRELARMMGGRTTEAGRRHARELLDRARRPRAVRGSPGTMP